MGLAQIPLPDAMVCTWHLPEYVMVFMWPFLPLFSKAPCALDLLGVPDLKHMFCYRTKESNIYVLLQGPEFEPRASLMQQLTNSLLPGLYCKNNFF